LVDLLAGTAASKRATPAHIALAGQHNPFQ